MQLRLEGPVGAEHRLDRQRRGDVGHREQVGRVMVGQQQHRQHSVGAVDQREPFLGREGQRAAAGRGQSLGGGPARPVRPDHPALTQQHQATVGQRRQVPGGAERPVLRHPRHEIVIEQAEQPFGHLGAHPGATHRQRPGPQQQHRPHHLAGHRRPHPGGVRAQQGVLELRPSLGRHHGGGQRPEAGGDAVDRPLLPLDRLDHRPAVPHRRHRLRGQPHLGPVAGHGHHIGRRQPAGSQDHRSAHRTTPLCTTWRTSGTPGR